ncbi:MAG: murein transglycosylase, partial [Xanthomonadales bacterium]|nr:murein transglycosylase [Xanthomonadales bacterium]
MRKVLAIASMFLASMFVSHNAVAQEKSKLDEVLARGKVIVGVSSESPPF